MAAYRRLTGSWVVAECRPLARKLGEPSARRTQPYGGVPPV